MTGAGNKHVFLYTPDGAPQASWKPKILEVLPTSPGSSTHRIVGWGLNGISEGGVYGDDHSASSNYPLVRLTDDQGYVTYATTSNWSTTQVGPAFGSFQFTTPAKLHPGTYALQVIASGIASKPVTFYNV